MQKETLSVSQEVLAILGHGDFDFRQELFKAAALFDNGARQLTIPVKVSDNGIKRVVITVDDSVETEPEQQNFI